MSVVDEILLWFNIIVLFYFLAINSSYLVFVIISAFEVPSEYRRAPLRGYQESSTSPLWPGISLVVAAYNEEAGIVDSVRSMLELEYPTFEVVVVEDGSKDETFARLAEEFDLREVPVVVESYVPTIGQVKSVHVPRGGENLVVVRKENAGRRADASNVGINIARHELVSIVDADCVMDRDGLLRVAQPFVNDPEHVVATGGVIRVANGCEIDRGELIATGMPDKWLPRIQVVEYLRAFLLGRVGWTAINGLLIISGAFGLFRRDIVIESGGFDLDCMGEDAELVATIHHRMRNEKRPYRMMLVPDTVNWTEVPETFKVLGRQRRRWSQGLTELLIKHRRMMFNPRYGRVGMVVLPYFLLFEVLGPFLELLGLVAVILGLIFGAINIPFAILFFLVAIGYGILVSLASVVIDDVTSETYRGSRNLLLLVAASILENVGFRQIHAWWRIRGVVSGVLGRESSWGTMTRTGLSAKSKSAGPTTAGGGS
ncbi:MAG: glycosyltransferase family 2 protein [Actinobacteria bacterium]|nr:glycosyltransferase family 2 protein [Actinomycetota bacterium]